MTFTLKFLRGNLGIARVGLLLYGSQIISQVFLAGCDLTFRVKASDGTAEIFELTSTFTKTTPNFMSTRKRGHWGPCLTGGLGIESRNASTSNSMCSDFSAGCVQPIKTKTNYNFTLAKVSRTCCCILSRRGVLALFKCFRCTFSFCSRRFL